MPLLLEAEAVDVTARRFEVPNLPVSNTDGFWYVTSFEGWDEATKPAAVLVGNGGGAGVVAVGPWLSAERYCVLAGVMIGPPELQTAFRSSLLTGLPTTADMSVVGYGVGEVDLQMFVRRYDAVEVLRRPEWMSFSVPLVAADPFRYALEPLSGTMGVFTSEDWYQLYTLSGSDWVETYALSGLDWVDTYQQAVASGPYPESLLFESPGDATSQRVTFTITGPLTAGDWWLLNETTGDRMWVEVGVADTQQLIVDSLAGTALLSGSDATHLVYGDFLTLAPGANLFRLQAGSTSSAFADVSALPAYL